MLCVNNVIVVDAATNIPLDRILDLSIAVVGNTFHATYIWRNQEAALLVDRRFRAVVQDIVPVEHNKVQIQLRDITPDGYVAIAAPSRE